VVRAMREGRPEGLDRQPWALLAGLWGNATPPGAAG